MAEPDLARYLPLTETTYYILLALAEPLHGYGIMQKVERMSESTVSIGPGTMYGALTNLEKEGLIEMVKEEERRKSYRMTSRGKQLLEEQIYRLGIMFRIGENILSSKKKARAK